MTIPIATTERIIRDAGIPRISSDATKLIVTSAETHIKDIATKAYAYAQHAGRSTLKEVDVKAALGFPAE